MQQPPARTGTEVCGVCNERLRADERETSDYWLCPVHDMHLPHSHPRCFCHEAAKTKADITTCPVCKTAMVGVGVHGIGTADAASVVDVLRQETDRGEVFLRHAGRGFGVASAVLVAEAVVFVLTAHRAVFRPWSSEAMIWPLVVTLIAHCVVCWRAATSAGVRDVHWTMGGTTAQLIVLSNGWIRRHPLFLLLSAIVLFAWTCYGEYRSIGPSERAFAEARVTCDKLGVGLAVGRCKRADAWWEVHYDPAVVREAEVMCGRLTRAISMFDLQQDGHDEWWRSLVLAAAIAKAHGIIERGDARAGTHRDRLELRPVVDTYERTW
jgi:hypothetical protein